MSVTLHDWTIAQHHQSSLVGSTMLKEFADSPRGYYSAYVAKTRSPERDTKALRFGNLWHTYLLEPHKFSPGLVRPDELKKLEYMKWSVEANADASSLLAEPGDCERTATWNYSIGLGVKARFDKFIRRDERDGSWKSIILDLKVSRRPDKRGFRRDCQDYGYLLQAGLYVRSAAEMQSTAISLPEFFWIVTGNEEPHETFVYHLSPDSRQRALDDVENHLWNLDESMVSGNWDHPQSREVEEI